MNKRFIILSIFSLTCLSIVSSSACTSTNYGNSKQELITKSRLAEKESFISKIGLINKENLVEKENLITSDNLTKEKEFASEDNLTEKEELTSKEKYKDYSDYYIDRVTTFKKLPHSNRDIIFLGDSLIDICEWDELLGNPLIKNRGISGDTTNGILDRLEEVVAGKPRKIFIMIGINDIGKGKKTEDIVKNYEKILQNIKESSPNTEVYIHSVLPINKDLFKTSTKEEEILNLNNRLKELCARQKLQYIDLYPLLVQSDNKLKTEYTTGGIHLNGKGYVVWREAVRSFL